MDKVYFPSPSVADFRPVGVRQLERDVRLPLRPLPRALPLQEEGRVVRAGQPRQGEHLHAF